MMRVNDQTPCEDSIFVGCQRRICIHKGPHTKHEADVGKWTVAWRGRVGRTRFRFTENGRISDTKVWVPGT